MIKIIEPMEYSVYQRDTSSRASITVSGKTNCDFDKMEILVSAKGKTSGVDDAWKSMAVKREARSFRGSLDILSGGWYTLKTRILSNGKVTGIGNAVNFGVGEVFITAGQSNMANEGEPKQKTRTGRVSSFNGTGWQISNDSQPICTGKEGSIIPLLGDLIVDTLDMPVGFLCLAVGGTDISCWNPDTQIPVGRAPKMAEALYARYFGRYIPDFIGKYGARALLWHQGEADRETQYEDYYRGLVKLIRCFKRDFNEQLPWLVAIVGGKYGDEKLGSGGCRRAQLQVIKEGLALQGPDTDMLGQQFRLNPQTSHFNSRGLRAHARLWFAMLYNHFWCTSA